MKAVLPLLVAALIAAALGGLACRAMGRPDVWRALGAAAAVTLVAAGLAVGSLSLTAPPGATQDAVASGALIASVAHLLLSTVFASVVLMSNAVDRHAFAACLLAFYWSTLVAVVVVLVRRLQAAPARPAAGR